MNVLQNRLNNTTNTRTQASLKTQISALQDQVQIPQSNQVNGETTTTATTNTTPITITTTNVFSSKVEGLGLVVEERKKAVDNSKAQLVKIINESVTAIITNTETSGKKTDTSRIYTLRDELLLKVDSSLGALTEDITPANINDLQIEIKKGIENVRSVAGDNRAIAQNDLSSKDITNTLNTLSGAVNDQAEALKAQGGDLLYKDSNKDGISDYDSVYVYNMSPTALSPVSTYEGKTINAAEKILLGFDPTQSEIVEVNKEQPTESIIASVPTYQVKEVALTENKAVLLKGQALPNSFITIYIYSTPIMVTVKTDSKGEWQYVLDKELENGDHTVYTASVNNSGNIIAKSPGYLFTKTAEAASLKDLPLAGASVEANKPGLLEGNNLYVIVTVLVLIIVTVLVLIGMTSKKNKENLS
ncbi:hypothetical protein A2818_02505 [Candidatus Nomurabacteria bacterium RIFCSPHIGHO2_01_FULL_40_12]|uniref:Uncharacterized protein n=1 Tax=Candidatus Nomurabacteria bacterium RIFCSPHIGHO2_01_FULL_40_12 TaxID=1801737 RepID=A0A1F6UYC1_9BACT|nr:MAG: hypothetical protein A2818_02505 [Candidatus Nomurabacteria bacterium RIFCSPHIGHO2_01_FULL_40_12]